MAIKLRHEGTDWRMVRYLAPLYGLFFLWAALRLQPGFRPSPGCWAVDLAAVGLAASRTCLPVIPFSGHVLFLVYTLVTIPSRTYRALAVLCLLDTAYLKLWVWRAPWSFLAGFFVAGLLLVTRLRACPHGDVLGSSPRQESPRWFT